MVKTCGRCSSNEFRRLNRNGFLERKLLPFFGFFPWECSLCRRKVFLRLEGYKARRYGIRSAPVPDKPSAGHAATPLR